MSVPPADPRAYHWHVMIGVSGRVAWRPVFASVRDAAAGALWYAERTGQACYSKTCYRECSP